MSKHFLQIASKLAGEHFGDVAKEIVNTLGHLGTQSISSIISQIKIPRKKVEEALRILIRHELITFAKSKSQIYAVYTLNRDRILILLRFPRYITIVKDKWKLSLQTRCIFEEIFEAGSITISKLLYNIVLRFQPGLLEVEKEEGIDHLSKLLNQVRDLISAKYICKCPELKVEVDDDEESEMEVEVDTNIPVFKEMEEGDLFQIPKVDLGLIVEKLKESNNDTMNCPDGSVYWKINHQIFDREILNEILISSVNGQFNKDGDEISEFLDPIVFRILLELGTKNNCMEMLLDETEEVNELEIKKEMEVRGCSSKNIKLAGENLNLLVDETNGIVTKTRDSHGGVYVVNLKSGFDQLVWSAVDKIVLERHGYFAARIFRLIRINKFVEQDRINELCMIPSKEAKNLTYILAQDNFIIMKEVRKSYTVSSASSVKPSYFFTLNTENLIHGLLEQCYKFVGNMQSRLDKEKDDAGPLLAKEDKINRILHNMEEKNCASDELYTDVKAMITPPEKEALEEFEITNTLLLSGIMAIDSMIYILDNYIKYSSKSKKYAATLASSRSKKRKV